MINVSSCYLFVTCEQLTYMCVIMNLVREFFYLSIICCCLSGILLFLYFYMRSFFTRRSIFLNGEIYSVLENPWFGALDWSWLIVDYYLILNSVKGLRKNYGVKYAYSSLAELQIHHHFLLYILHTQIFLLPYISLWFSYTAVRKAQVMK